MLRITCTVDDTSLATLKLEGKLVGPWVAELRQTCAQRPACVGGWRLDLSAVSFVDEAGVQLLREQLRLGATLSACSAVVRALLREECP
jgi:anti-anti-sigma regulatory factor